MKNIDVTKALPTLHGRARRRWLSDRACRRKARHAARPAVDQVHV